jgi:hypothetical protein
VLRRGRLLTAGAFPQVEGGLFAFSTEVASLAECGGIPPDGPVGGHFDHARRRSLD